MSKSTQNQPTIFRRLLQQMFSHSSPSEKGQKPRQRWSLLPRYFRDIINRHYRNYNSLNLLLVLATIVYVFSPLDFIPDLIPGGIIDDAGMIVWAIRQLGKELNRYQDFLENQNTSGRVEK